MSGAPIIILVEPQLAENIGMAARAMVNFGLSELRLVAPRDGWPKKGARAAASGAVHVLDEARLFATAREAIADLNFVLATTARERGQMKRVWSPEDGLREARRRLAAGEKVGILFGRERTGLENDEISLADAIITFPVEPGLLVPQPRPGGAARRLRVVRARRRWRRLAVRRRAIALAARETRRLLLRLPRGRARRGELLPARQAPIMARNMRDIFQRRELTEQDVRSLRGALRALDRRAAVEEAVKIWSLEAPVSSPSTERPR